MTDNRIQLADLQETNREFAGRMGRDALDSGLHGFAFAGVAALILFLTRFWVGCYVAAGAVGVIALAWLVVAAVSGVLALQAWRRDLAWKALLG